MSALQKEHVQWLQRMGWADASPPKCCALIACAEAFDTTYGGRKSTGARLKKNAKARYHELLSEQYGSVIVLFILLTVAGAALSWAVERMLDWLFPSVEPDRDRIKALREEQQKWKGA